MNNPDDKILVLYAEDEENDRVLVEYALKRAAPQVTLITASDGVEAIRWLGNRRGVEQSPSCVLLDLNLPRKNGFEVLSWIREQPEYKTLRVIVLTSSDLQQDRDRALNLGADAYEVKTGELRKYVEFLSGLFGPGGKAES